MHSQFAIRRSRFAKSIRDQQVESIKQNIRKQLLTGNGGFDQEVATLKKKCVDSGFTLKSMQEYLSAIEEVPLQNKCTPYVLRFVEQILINVSENYRDSSEEIVAAVNYLLRAAVSFGNTYEHEGRLAIEMYFQQILDCMRHSAEFPVIFQTWTLLSEVPSEAFGEQSLGLFLKQVVRLEKFTQQTLKILLVGFSNFTEYSVSSTQKATILQFTKQLFGQFTLKGRDMILMINTINNLVPRGAKANQFEIVRTYGIYQQLFTYIEDCSLSGVPLLRLLRLIGTTFYAPNQICLKIFDQSKSLLRNLRRLLHIPEPIPKQLMGWRDLKGEPLDVVINVTFCLTNIVAISSKIVEDILSCDLARCLIFLSQVTSPDLKSELAILYYNLVVNSADFHLEALCEIGLLDALYNIVEFNQDSFTSEVILKTIIGILTTSADCPSKNAVWHYNTKTIIRVLSQMGMLKWIHDMVEISAVQQLAQSALDRCLEGMESNQY